MENPRTELLVQPEWSTLIFGDGYNALMRGAIEIEDEDGIKIIEATIQPHTHLRKRYNIKDSDLDNNGNISSYKMKKNDLIPLNQFDDANRTWLYIKNYNGEETEITNVEWKLRKLLEESEKKRRILEGENTWYSEQLLLAKTNPIEFAGQSLEIFEKITSNALEAIRSKKDRDDTQ